MSRSRTLNAYQHRKSVFEIAGDLLVYVFSVITCQGKCCFQTVHLIYLIEIVSGGQIGNRWLSTILIAGSWCLAAVVIVNGYSSTLTSFLSVRSYDPVVSTWQDVAKSRLQLIVERNSVLEDIIMASWPFSLI